MTGWRSFLWWEMGKNAISWSTYRRGISRGKRLRNRGARNAFSNISMFNEMKVDLHRWYLLNVQLEGRYGDNVVIDLYLYCCIWAYGQTILNFIHLKVRQQFEFTARTFSIKQMLDTTHFIIQLLQMFDAIPHNRFKQLKSFLFGITDSNIQ